MVQTFGHLEFILKHEEFSYLRDVASMPESICPCDNDTMGIVREIVDQVMAVHKDTKYLHIGCDEVFHLGKCKQCKGQDRTSLFVDHVTKVAEYVRQTYQVTPIIWDDMLRSFTVEEMQPLGTLVEPMVWVYAEDVERFVPPDMWDRYGQVFDYLWTASAFKGAHGETLVVPDINKHLTNNLNWLTLMAQEEPKIKQKSSSIDISLLDLMAQEKPEVQAGFRGIVLTGWQRYDHFAVLCELLPAAIPSLTINLLATSRGFFDKTLINPLLEALECIPDTESSNSFVDLKKDRYLWEKLSECNFPGINFFRFTKKLIEIEIEVMEFINKMEKKRGWLTEYNKRHNMSSPYRIDEAVAQEEDYAVSLISLMRRAVSDLSDMYDDYTVYEWVEQKLYPLYTTTNRVKTEAAVLRKVKYWPARPYQHIEELKKLQINL